MASANTQVTPGMTQAQKLTRYKAWSNQRTYSFLHTLPEDAPAKPRDTFFGSILHTLQHTYIVDDIFKAHLESRAHGYGARRSDAVPTLSALTDLVEEMDRWWIELSDGLSGRDLDETISFKFIGGDPGLMTRLDIIMHVVNHASYHRGFVDQLLGQTPVDSPACDYPVFLMDMT